MPELPDLTVYAENLGKAVIGKEIAKVFYEGKGKSKVPPQELAKALVSAKIEKVRRVGKQLCFDIDNGSVICIHLMLNGGFVLTDAREVERLDSLVLAISFKDGTALAVTDPKQWASVGLNPEFDPEVPDGLEITEEYLRALFKKKPRMKAKAFLLDQALVGGIGNAYSDEILWRARISPKSSVGKLPAEAVAALVEAIPVVLKEAVVEIRKRRPEVISGEVRDFLKVHGSGKKVSPTGRKIIKEQIQSKITYYTDEQTLYE